MLFPMKVIRERCSKKERERREEGGGADWAWAHVERRELGRNQVLYLKKSH